MNCFLYIWNGLYPKLDHYAVYGDNRTKTSSSPIFLLRNNNTITSHKNFASETRPNLYNGKTDNFQIEGMQS